MKNGWQTRRLADFALVVSTGPFGSILHKSDYVEDGVPLVNPINIVGERIVPNPLKLISGVTKRRLSNYVLKEGDVVVGRRGEIGRCAVVGSNENGWVCGTGSFFVRPLQTLNPQFLAHLIRADAYREKLEQLSTGATMKNLSNAALGDLAISVPSVPEQRRIVGILNEAFEGIAAAKANAEKNLQNARAIFESHLQSVFTQRGPEWVEKPLGEVCTLQRGFDLPTHLRQEGRVPLVTSNGITDTNNVWKVKGPGVVTGRSGSIGNVFFIKDDFWPLNTTLYVKDFHGNDPAFIYRLLIQFDLGKHATGAGVPTLNRNFVHYKPVRIPVDISVQRALTEKLNDLESETKRLADIYHRKLTVLEALKKSLLHQAFSGKL
jgi:type I restriction enzyme S subunit